MCYLVFPCCTTSFGKYDGEFKGAMVVQVGDSRKAQQRPRQKKSAEADGKRTRMIGAGVRSALGPICS